MKIPANCPSGFKHALSPARHLAILQRFDKPKTWTVLVCMLAHRTGGHTPFVSTFELSRPMVLLIPHGNPKRRRVFRIFQTSRWAKMMRSWAFASAASGFWPLEAGENLGGGGIWGGLRGGGEVESGLGVGETGGLGVGVEEGIVCIM